MKKIEPSIEITANNGFIYENLTAELRINRNFYIVIHDLSVFLESTIETRYFFGIDQLFNTANYDRYLPVIHISLIDFLNDKDKTLKNLVPNLLRYKNVINSGIWNYYVPYHKENGKDFKERLEEAINEINKNRTLGLYDSKNAKEIAEFKNRILQQSYLDSRGGHGNLVVPFLFHSESKMKEKAREEFNKLPKNLSWRFLLIDDHATEQSAGVEKHCISKCKIVKNILCQYGFVCKCVNYEKQKEYCPTEMCVENCKTQNNECNQRTIYFDCAEKKDKDKNKLKETKYDLILMDYLLEKNDDGTRNYAHDILIDIQKHFKDSAVKSEKSEWKKIAGPNGSFHFFFISAFTNAINERMLSEGLDFHETYWHISRGACPTTTPHLFSYYLLKTMNRQIEQMSDSKDIVTLLDLLTNIYINKKTCREQAIDKYNSLLKIRSRYDDLKYDACIDIKTKKKIEDRQYKSKLVNSLFPDIPYYDNAIWEHTMLLIYLTAFGTIRQWHDMWDEFMLIKPYLSRIPDNVKVKYKDGSGNIKNDKTAKDIIKHIENYITSLQQASQ